MCGVAAVIAAGDGFTNRLESVDGAWKGGGVTASRFPSRWSFADGDVAYAW